MDRAQGDVLQTLTRVDRFLPATVPAVHAILRTTSSPLSLPRGGHHYDGLFERAWRDAGRSPAIVPQQRAHDAESWLLKLHGSVDDPDRIVLSRGDYLRFEGSGVALAGIVQAMLLTRHMLFVGYSLSDDNFQCLVHQVRQEDVRYVSTANGDDRDARRLAILLDRIGWEAPTPAAHMLDAAYRAVFSDDEWALRECIDAVAHAAKAGGVRPAVAEASATLRGGLGDGAVSSGPTTRTGTPAADDVAPASISNLPPT